MERVSWKSSLDYAGSFIYGGGVCWDILVYEIYNIIEFELLYVGCTATPFYIILCVYRT